MFGLFQTKKWSFIWFEFLIEGKGEASIKLSGLPKRSSELSLL